ncbi:acetyltransferase [Albibacterium bauzanense]|uniref:Acetyltransferase EpsM n=1 Tax=Albibacterium bauzanense TaxID=653929 RepID=A0A4R1M5B0_9SPHI|nr:acetyltransferase [Albibacterium bauzanense]TCK84933.1 acetyltransferase EpsM [Albibacterium bauzanense]
MVYLIGASGHAKVIIEILEDLDIKVGGLLDSNPEIKTLLDYKVYEGLPVSFNPNEDKLIISIGNNAIRKRLASSSIHKFISVRHINTSISKRSTIGEGTVIMAGVSMNSSCNIGNHVIINTNASIDHDCILENYVHISPNAALAGNVQIGEGTHVGIGACIIQGIKIGRWCTIGAGAVIIHDVPDGATVIGNPGRIIKMGKI